MGLWDKLKGNKADEDDAVVLGVVTGTPASIWYDDNGDDDNGDSEGDSADGAGEDVVA